jgi:hypothetical protein
MPQPRRRAPRGKDAQAPIGTLSQEYAILRLGQPPIPCVGGCGLSLNSSHPHERIRELERDRSPQRSTIRREYRQHQLQ